MLTDAILETMTDDLWMIAQSPSVDLTDKERAYLMADELAELLMNGLERCEPYNRAEAVMADLLIAVHGRTLMFVA